MQGVKVPGVGEPGAKGSGTGVVGARNSPRVRRGNRTSCGGGRGRGRGGGRGHGCEGMGSSRESSSFGDGWAPKTPPAQDERREWPCACWREGVWPATLEGGQRFLLGSPVLSVGVNLRHPFRPGEKQAGFAPVFRRHHCP